MTSDDSAKVVFWSQVGEIAGFEWLRSYIDDFFSGFFFSSPIESDAFSLGNSRIV